MPHTSATLDMHTLQVNRVSCRALAGAGMGKMWWSSGLRPSGRCHVNAALTSRVPTSANGSASSCPGCLTCTNRGHGQVQETQWVLQVTKSLWLWQ